MSDSKTNTTTTTTNDDDTKTNSTISTKDTGMVAWSITDKQFVIDSLDAHTAPSGLQAMPSPLVSLILEFAAGHLWVGSMVDVKDQIGKWVFGRIIDVAEDAETKEVQKARNCHKCGALSSFDATECLICGAPKIGPKKPVDTSHFTKPTHPLLHDSDSDSDSAPPLSEECLSQLGPGACMTRQGSDGPPTEADKLGTRVKISFYGWDEEFDEWVTLDRVRPGGTKITSTWLKPGSTVCLGEKDVKKMGASNMLMARVLALRPNPATVFDVKVQVDPSIPFSFRVPGERRQASKEELEGMWVGLNDGIILQNGSFNTCIIA